MLAKLPLIVELLMVVVAEPVNTPPPLLLAELLLIVELLTVVLALV